MHKVYVVPAESPQQLPELLFLVVLSAAGQLRFERRSSMLLRQHKNSPDATVLAAGLATLLQQLKSSYLEVGGWGFAPPTRSCHEETRMGTESLADVGSLQTRLHIIPCPQVWAYKSVVQSTVYGAIMQVISPLY